MQDADHIVQRIEPTIRGLGYELWGIERNRSAQSQLVRIFIDAPAGIVVEDCARVSNQLTRMFMVENIDYDRLEISSPGLDRPLKKTADFARFAGQEAVLKLRAPLGGVHGIRKNFQAVVAESNGKPAMQIDGEWIELDWAQIDKARLVPVIEF